MAETGVGFGYKLQWLAVRHRGAEAVTPALGLDQFTPATWRDAVEAAYAGRWLLTPPLDGWTLAASARVPAPEDDRFPAWLAGLSRLLGEVQYFGTHRVVEYHGWGRARDGVVERAYAWLGERGETLFDAGPPTTDERAALAETDEGDEPDGETVLALAGRWSVDPRSLGGVPVSGRPWIAAPGRIR